MYNAANRLIAGALCAIALTGVTACGDDSKHKAAQDLLARAETSLEAKDYTTALGLLDSLNTAYRDQTDVRRESMRVHAMAIEGVTVDSIVECGRRLASLQLRADSLAPLFRDVEGSRGLAGYKVAKSAYAPAQLNTSCVQPRIDEDNYFYLIANLQGRSIGLHSVTAGDGTSSASTVAVSPDLLVKVEGSEMVSIRQESAAPLAIWLQSHAGDATLTFNGTKGDYKAKLPAATAEAIRLTWQYAQTLQELRQTLIRREKLERTLQTARNQLANAPARTGEDK